MITTEVNRAEVVEYIPYFAARYRLEEALLFDLLAIVPIDIYGEREYASHLPQAEALLARRDPDDVALAALALKFEVPIWSNDRDYERFPTGVFTTAQLLASLGV